MHALLSRDGGRRLKTQLPVRLNMGRSDAFGYVLLALLALQYGLQPFLTSRFLSKAGCDARAVVLVTELAKAALCACSLLLKRSPAGDTRRPATRDVLQTAAPAACYLVQNLALQQAYADLDSLTFNCLNQSKLAATAFFLYVLLRQRQSAQQLVALALLLAAGLLLQLTGEQRAASSAGSAVKSFRRGVAVSSAWVLQLASGLRSLRRVCSGMPAGFCAVRPGVYALPDLVAGKASLQTCEAPAALTRPAASPSSNAAEAQRRLRLRWCVYSKLARLARLLTL